MTSTRVDHRQSIELARFVAAFGILFVHVFITGGVWIGHLSLSLFLILTAFLSVQSMQRAQGRFDWLKRAPRILLPWLFWAAFYKLVLVVVTDGPAKYAVLTDPWSLLVGPFVHLWFLPFVLLASLCVAPMGRTVTSARGVMRGSAVLGVIGLLAIYVQTHVALPEPLPQWLYSVPSYGYGLLAAFALVLGGGQWPLIVMGVLCVTSCVVTGLVWTLMPLPAALLFQLAWKVPLSGRILPHLGQVAFGIYLLHPFFLLVCYKLFGAQVNAWLALGLTFAMSWGATIALRAMPFMWRMV